jgi:phage-related protein (TIGR01555 family)
MKKDSLFVRAMKRVMKSDAWENVVTLLGTSYDKSTYHRVYPEVWYDCDELEDLYYGDSYARRAIEEPVDAAFRQGYDLTNEKAFDSETFNEDKDKIQLVLDEHDAVCQLKEALYWGALYGRGGLLLGVDDGQDLETPLDLERVKELKYLEVLQCQDFHVESTYTDLEEPLYGQPEFWRVTRQSDNLSDQVVVHESRILLTRGAPTSIRKRRENDWRDASMLQGPYKYLRNWDAANQGGANMMTDSSQAVLSIAEFNKMIGSDDLTIFSNRMRVLEMARSLRIMPIDAESEKFQYVERSFQGVFEMIDRAAQALAGAVGIPQTIYFGRAPAGLNATGESDTRGWYDKVRAQREAKYQPLFERIIQIIAKAEGLQYPDQWGVSWPSLWQETAKEKAETDKKVAETDKLYLDMGAITEDEIAETRFGGDELQRGVIQVDLEARAILKEQDLKRAKEGVPEEEPFGEEENPKKLEEGEENA